MAKMNLIYDNFADVYALREAIQTRPDNGTAGHSAKSNSEDFAGMPLEKAYEALTDGIPEVVERLKRELVRFNVKNANAINQRRPINYYNGHSPNVPAAIMGLPKSMRKNVRTPSKVKTISLYFDPCIPCSIDASALEKSGFAVFQLVYWLEKCGYRVKLTVVPVNTGDNKDKHTEYGCCTVLLKDYRQPLDMLKLSFSLTSISMWRRLGFKWIETAPGMKSNWYAYGRLIDKETRLNCLKEAGHDLTNAFYINHYDCREVDYNAVELAKKLGIEV